MYQYAFMWLEKDQNNVFNVKVLVGLVADTQKQFATYHGVSMTCRVKCNFNHFSPVHILVGENPLRRKWRKLFNKNAITKHKMTSEEAGNSFFFKRVFQFEITLLDALKCYVITQSCISFYWFTQRVFTLFCL